MRRARRSLYRSASLMGDMIALGGGPAAWVARWARRTMWKMIARMMP